MKQNSRLWLALHTLGHMAHEPDRMHTSAEIADHAGTNPVVVRRVLGRLRESGLLVSEKGHAGGWRLARAPKNITLADIYLALDENIVAPPPADYARSCAVESELHRHVTTVLLDAERSLVKQLGETTLAQFQDV